MSRSKTKSISRLRKDLWELTSHYVRRSVADSNGYCVCVTCGLTRHWKELQAGHFIPKAQGNAVAWDLRNINPQCYRCNINLGGNGAEYYPFMVERHGQAVVDELRALSNTTVKITRTEYETYIEDMKARLRRLDSGQFDIPRIDIQTEAGDGI